MISWIFGLFVSSKFYIGVATGAAVGGTAIKKYLSVVAAKAQDIAKKV